MYFTQGLCKILPPTSHLSVSSVHITSLSSEVIVYFTQSLSPNETRYRQLHIFPPRWITHTHAVQLIGSDRVFYPVSVYNF